MTPSANARPRPADGSSKAGYHHGDLRRALIEAARAILENEGLAKLSLREAARRAGVSQAAPYHHFKDKTALLAAVAARGFREFDDALRAHMDAVADPSAKLTESGVAYVAFAADNPALFRLMFGPQIEDAAAHQELAEAAAAAYCTLEDATAEALRAQGANLAQTPAQALCAWSSVHGLATLLLEGGVTPRDYGAASPAELARLVLGARNNR